MKLKLTFLIALLGICYQLQAQILGNIYDDTRAIQMNRRGGDPFAATNADSTANRLKKYIPSQFQGSTKDIISYMQQNPFIIAAGSLFTIPSATSDSIKGSAVRELEVGFIPFLSIFKDKGSGTFSATSPGFTTTSIVDSLTNLIIERAKAELTATFFEQLKNQLQKNPELTTAFPKTTAFIGQIQPYLYASYLPTLRQAFLTDINSLPMQIGAILRFPRMKKYMAQNPNSKAIWYVVPVLQCLSDLSNGKSIADAIKDLNPDIELNSINPAYYNALKLVAVLSESIRDKTGKQNWVNFSDLNTLLHDPTERALFFAMIYESTKYLPTGQSAAAAKISNFITTKDTDKVKLTLQTFTDATAANNDLFNAYQDIKDTSNAGRSIHFSQLITLIKNSETSITSVLNDINALNTKTDEQISTDSLFKDFPQLIEILGNFNSKNYSSGIMNSMLLISKYLKQNTTAIQPFTGKAYLSLNTANVGNLSQMVQVALKNLNAYAAANPNDDIKSLIVTLNAIPVSTPPTQAQIKEVDEQFSKISAHNYKLKSTGFDAYDIYQKLLKYGVLMASLAEAKTSADVSSALEAAVLPVGSSSIKYYTSFSFSINSYIGAAYYSSNYNFTGTNNKLNFNTLGVALPIGLNFSVGTRSSIVGAVSLFASVIDLGAIASYRLDNPPNSTNQTLPAFTFQNLLAPGGFVVLNRILKTPLVIGIGIQRAPQLSSISTGSADLTTDPKWRVGAFLSVDIPLFDLYSKSLKRPLN